MGHTGAVRHNIVEGEPGIFPDPVARILRIPSRWFARRRSRERPDQPAEAAPDAPAAPESPESPEAPETGDTGDAAAT